MKCLFNRKNPRNILNFKKPNSIIMNRVQHFHQSVSFYTGAVKSKRQRNAECLMCQNVGEAANLG